MDTQQQIDLLNQQIEQHPTDPARRLQRAQLLYKMGKFGEALNDYRKVIAIDPTNTEATAAIELIEEILSSHFRRYYDV